MQSEEIPTGAGWAEGGLELLKGTASVHLAQQWCRGWDELGRAAPQQQMQAESPVGALAWSSPAAAGCQGRVAARGT